MFEKPMKSDELMNEVVKAQAGNKRSMDKVVTSNMRLVAKIAKKFRAQGTDYEDLVQQGSFGLIRALDKFDPKRGVKFTTYASHYIFAELSDYVMKNHSIVNAIKTQDLRKAFWRLSRETSKLKAQGIEATPDALAEILDMPVKTIKKMQEINGSRVCSMSATTADGNGSSLSETIASDSDQGKSVEDNKMGHWLHQTMVDFSNQLQKRTEYIVFWLRVVEDETLQMTGDALGITRQRVKQLESALKPRFIKYARNRA